MTGFDISPDSARTAMSGIAFVDVDDEAVLDDYARAIWTVLTEPGDGIAGALISASGPTEALRQVLADAPRARELTGEYGAALQRWTPRLSPEAVDSACRIAQRRGVRLITTSHALWPVQLDDLGVHVPIALWARGRLAVLPGLRPSVAIVGARAATSYGDHVARELAADLSGSASRSSREPHTE